MGRGEKWMIQPFLRSTGRKECQDRGRDPRVPVSVLPQVGAGLGKVS